MYLRDLSRSVLLAVAILPLSTRGADAQAPEPMRLDTIRTRIDSTLPDSLSLVDEVVEVEGIATHYVEQSAETTSFFILQDDWGGTLQIRTSSAAPTTNERYRVRGVVGIGDDGEPYISEERRQFIPRPGTREALEPAEDGPAWWVIALAGAAGLLLIYGLARAIKGARSGRAPTAGAQHESAMQDSARVASSNPRPPHDHSDAVAAPASRLFEGKTIKFYHPPSDDGTLQLLPGHLRVVAGADAGETIRFVQPAGGTAEISFGRSSGPPYTHVQLTEKTVSREHAVMRRVDGTWQIVNQSRTNPVVVNGDELGANEGAHTLADGDVIEMGEVKFEFGA